MIAQLSKYSIIITLIFQIFVDYRSLAQNEGVREAKILDMSSDAMQQIMENALAKFERMRVNELKSALYRDNDAIVERPLAFNKIKLGFIAYFMGEEMKKRLKEFNMTKSKIKRRIESMQMNGTMFEDECPYMSRQNKSLISTGLLRDIGTFADRTCNPRYREIDGYCNNLKYPFRGTSHSPAQRFLKPDFGDGLSTPRLNKKGKPLPHPRIINMAVLPMSPKAHPFATSMVMVFGQLMDHEFSLVSSPTGYKYGGLGCCMNGSSAQMNKVNPLCLAMDIPSNDSFFSIHHHQCMEVVRSFPVISKDCKLGNREMNNEITSYIDGSAIYGSTPNIANSLRTFRLGQLWTQSNPNGFERPLLPVSPISFSRQCEIRVSDRYPCFAAGDERTNENSLLIAIHTLFHREHNRIANALHSVNPLWEDERLYQEARRIVAAELQHIAYNEFLPIVIGEANVRRFNLSSLEAGYLNAYDEEIDASLDHGFATAAFRFGHSLIDTTIRKMDQFNRMSFAVSLRRDFFQPQHIYTRNNLDAIYRGMTNHPTQMMDHHVVEDVRNHLFKLPIESFGMDLMSLNILRAREHGAPSYNKWRKFCGFNPFKTFADMRSHFPDSVVDAFKQVYEHPDDIDLFMGGVSEISPAHNISMMRHGILGPTFSCIVANQFHRFKFGDRFWYENKNIPDKITHQFTSEQLINIRTTTLAGVICRNTDSIGRMHRNVFLRPNKGRNRRIRCTRIPDINANLWNEQYVRIKD